MALNNLQRLICHETQQTKPNRRGVMVKAQECGIVVNEFELQSSYYVYFRVSTLRKDMNTLIIPASG